MSEAAKWELRYRNKEHGNLLTPDPLLVRHAERFRQSHVVVDLACGTGRHSVFLASLGCFVIALDFSQEALHRCQSLARQNRVRIHPVAADLTETRLPPDSVDGIVCVNYLNRDLADNLQSALRAGGVLLMKTFNVNFLQVNPRFNPAYVLHPGDLSKLFGQMQIIEMSDECAPNSNTESYIVAHSL